ncbi:MULTISPECIES: hypothetical protein [unclassified Crossiella]|uniref:hypothetical protein n=1 Tax=unclassified Crossiella TaxID=2620835 RepID=UPI001FFF085B|nr:MULTISPECIES: hypothetical protein [unclassified Crossiella]MCK2240945.1 hypothetical protein [Crossiella sp. S99.2]MCK2253911.1 hypothetical protein [Crossiella sp. S99.1]
MSARARAARRLASVLAARFRPTVGVEVAVCYDRGCGGYRVRCQAPSATDRAPSLPEIQLAVAALLAPDAAVLNALSSLRYEDLIWAPGEAA